jgi:hypothetical protein
MVDQAELMGVFSNLVTNKSPVTLYNTYRGLPFNHSADILKFEAGRLSTRVHRYQAVSMTQEGCTHLQNRTFREVIRANVDDIDYRMMQATLCEFTPAGDSIGKRMATASSQRFNRSRGLGWAPVGEGSYCRYLSGWSVLLNPVHVHGFSIPRVGAEVSIDFIPPVMHRWCVLMRSSPISVSTRDRTCIGLD